MSARKTKVWGIMAAAVFAAASFASPVGAADITVYVSPPDADTYVNRADAGSGHGGATTLIVQSASTNDNRFKRSVVRFNLTDFAAALPVGATIIDASLKLWMTSMTTSGTTAVTRTYNLYKCANNTWTEATASLTGPNQYLCAHAPQDIANAVLLTSQTTPSTDGFLPQAMTWTHDDLKAAVIAAVGAADKRITLLVKDSDDTQTGNPANHRDYIGTFASKEGAPNTYPTDDFDPVLVITYREADIPPVCTYPVEITDFSATPGTIVSGQTSSFDVSLTIYACEDIAVHAQGGSAGNTTTSNLDCHGLGTCNATKPGGSAKNANGNQIIRWDIPDMQAGEYATLDFTVTTGDNPAEKAICRSDSLASILKNVTGRWSVTASYFDGPTPMQFTATHGQLVVNINCGTN